jgi:CcmD family protein
MQVLLDAGVAIYVAMSVALVVWVGIFLYLLRLDAHARELKRLLTDAHAQTAPAAPRVQVEQRTPNA